MITAFFRQLFMFAFNFKAMKECILKFKAKNTMDVAPKHFKRWRDDEKNKVILKSS